MSYLILKKLFEEQSLLNDICGILHWDMATYMPLKSRKERVKQINKLFDYKKRIFDEIKKKELFKKIENLNLKENDRLNLLLMKEKFDYFEAIPFELIQKKNELSIECEGLWREAKKKSSFNIVKGSLRKLLDQVKIESEILSQIKNMNRYDCLMNKYDRSLDSKFVKKIFSKIEKFIKLKLPEINKKKLRSNSLSSEIFLDENEQFKLSKIFMKKLDFDFDKGRIDKSPHPFCGGGTNDIRITTRFDENNPFSCFDALMHETGHGLYEQGLPRKWIHQPLGSAGGMSLHESQSLFIEMQVIKSLPVSKFITRILKSKFKKNNNKFNFLDVFESRIKVEPNFIRVDSDEVYYPLHIIHRFNIEYKIIEENADINFLPDLWNQEFSRLMNLDVSNDSNGCLQDIHWFGGDLGYFPTYSIGAFIAAQLMNKLKKDIVNFDLVLENGDFSIISNWLKKNIHEKGNIYNIDDLLELVTGEKLNTKHYENHIINRYVNKAF
ncbi:MAG: carboxypeptidase M32 [Alphaproteobacteria bacterium]